MEEQLFGTTNPSSSSFFMTLAATSIATDCDVLPSSEAMREMAVALTLTSGDTLCK